MGTIRYFGPLVLGAFAATLFSLAGCANPMQSSGAGGGSPSSSPSSTGTQTLWSDGYFGTWFGDALSAQEHGLDNYVQSGTVDTVT
ncbi:MAG: hypothetical protein ACREKE_08415, partial [bacterium]